MNSHTPLQTAFIATSLLAMAFCSTTARAQTGSPVATISSLPCSQLSSQAMPMQSFVPGSRPFGIPLRAWSSETFDALRRRVEICYAGKSGSDATLASRQIDYFEHSAQPYIEQIARDADRTEALKQSLLSELSEIQSESDLSAAEERLTQIQRRFEATKLPSPDRAEVAAAVDEATTAVERRLREETDAKARDEKVRAAEADARARRQAADQSQADAERRQQAAAKAAADVEDRKRNHAARLQAEADAKAKVEAALKEAAEAEKQTAEAEKARSEAAEREQAARDEDAKLEAEERAASDARRRAEEELKRKRASSDVRASRQAFITPAPSNKGGTAPREDRSNPPADRLDDRMSMDSEEGVRFTMLAGAEALFRVCADDYGQYVSELEQAKAEGARLGQLLVSQNVLTAEKLATFRDQTGLTTGRGLMILQARKHPDTLVACEEAAVALNLPKN